MCGTLWIGGPRRQRIGAGGKYHLDQAGVAGAGPSRLHAATIDDYGTGRSKLQLLACVDGASKKRALGTVLSSCLGVARSLDRMSVAVGVETKQEWDFLQGLGCTCVQGYHIARPMEATAFPGWFEDWRQFF